LAGALVNRMGLSAYEGGAIAVALLADFNVDGDSWQI
jgi:hypothetical protein